MQTVNTVSLHNEGAVRCEKRMRIAFVKIPKKRKF